MTQSNIQQLVQQNNTKAFIEAVEKELFLQLVYSLKHAEIAVEEAKKIAQEFLQAREKQTINEFLQAFYTLAYNRNESREVFVKFAGVYYEHKRVQTLFTVRVHMKNGELDLALHVAKGGVN